MPRNPSTGIYTRVVNSFSEPVLGEVIDPTDASALFDDQTDALNDLPAQLITGLTSSWSVQGMFAELNSSDADLLTMDMTASAVVLANPDTGSVLPGGSAAALPCDLGATGAGGRDTGSAPASGERWWFYFIKGIGQALDTIGSKTGPFDGGPLLPADYTHYAPAFPVVISDADNLVFDSHQADESTRGTFNGHIALTTLTEDSAVTGSPLAIGKKITGAGVLANTLITAGSSPTWTVSKSQTVGSGGSPVAMTATTPYPSAPNVFDTFVEFSTQILDNLSDVIVIGTPYDWSYATWIPEDALSIQLQVSLQVSCSDSTLDEFTGGFVFTWLDPGEPSAGNSVNASLNSFGYRQPAYADPIVSFPVQSTMQMKFTWVNGNGASNATQVTVAMPLGFSFER